MLTMLLQQLGRATIGAHAVGQPSPTTDCTQQCCSRQVGGVCFIYTRTPLRARGTKICSVSATSPSAPTLELKRFALALALAAQLIWGKPWLLGCLELSTRETGSTPTSLRLQAPFYAAAAVPPVEDF